MAIGDRPRFITGKPIKLMEQTCYGSIKRGLVPLV